MRHEKRCFKLPLILLSPAPALPQPVLFSAKDPTQDLYTRESTLPTGHIASPRLLIFLALALMTCTSQPSLIKLCLCDTHTLGYGASWDQFLLFFSFLKSVPISKPFDQVTLSAMSTHALLIMERFQKVHSVPFQILVPYDKVSEVCLLPNNIATLDIGDL